MKRYILLGALGALLSFVVSCQKTPTAELSVSQNEYTVQASGGSVNVSVSSNVDLTVRISAGWITQAGGPSSGGGTYSFTVAHNDGYDARTATITFSNGEQGVSETVTVTQSQQDANNALHEHILLHRIRKYYHFFRLYCQIKPNRFEIIVNCEL